MFFIYFSAFNNVYQTISNIGQQSSTVNTVLGEASTAAPGIFQNWVNGVQQFVNNIGGAVGSQPSESGTQGNEF